jgi:hypothetical protein
MPPKKNTTTDTMEARISALEEQFANLEVSVNEAQTKAEEHAAETKDTIKNLSAELKEQSAKAEAEWKDNFNKLLSMMKELQKSNNGHGKSVIHKDDRTGPSNHDDLDEFRLSVKKVELPMFSGEDPAGWIARAEVYFRVQGTSPEIKVDLAQLCMDGSTIHFFKALIEENEGLTWEELKNALLERYGVVSEGNVYEQLASLQQEGEVEEFIEDFEGLISQVPRLSDEQFVGYFIHGLKEGIRGRVRSLITLGPVSRHRLMNVAKAVEREIYGKTSYRTSKKPHYGESRHNRGGFHNPGSSHYNGRSFNNDPACVRSDKDHHEHGGVPSGVKTAIANDKGEQGRRDKGIRHLSSQEIAERRHKGLCFKCGGPFHPRHQCPDRQLRVMVTDEDDTMEEETDENERVYCAQT